jgi:hypothetical protein
VTIPEQGLAGAGVWGGVALVRPCETGCSFSCWRSWDVFFCSNLEYRVVEKVSNELFQTLFVEVDLSIIHGNKQTITCALVLFIDNIIPLRQAVISDGRFQHKPTCI